MPNIAIRLFLGCLLLCVTPACWGQEPADFHERTVFNSHNPWLVPPQTDKQPSPADQAARKALLELVGRKQTPKFRANAKIEVPEHASGVPEAYEITLYGKYVEWAYTAARLHIRVTGKQALAELVDDSGIARGELPLQQVDRLARQLAYAFQSRVKVRKDGLSGRRWGSHVPYFTIELFAKDDLPTLHFQSEPWQTIFDDIDLDSDDLRSFMHSRLCKSLLHLARSELTRLAANEQRVQIAKELKRIPVEPPPGEDPKEWAKEIYLRNDRAAVEIVLFTHLAVQQVVPDVLADLRRLQADKAIARWQIVTAADWPMQLAKVLVDKDDSVERRWALDFATKPPRRDMTAQLIELLTSAPPDIAVEIARRLVKFELTVIHLDRIETAFRKAPPGELKAMLAVLLLNQTQQYRYYDYLLTLAQPVAEANKTEVGQIAIESLLAYSGRTKIRREDAYVLLKELLKDVPVPPPAEAFEWKHRNLIDHLGRLGTQADLPLLEELAASKSRYAANAAIDAMARLDPELAVRRARERIAAFATFDDHNAYLWNVAYSLDLLFW